MTREYEVFAVMTAGAAGIARGIGLPKRLGRVHWTAQGPVAAVLLERAPVAASGRFPARMSRAARQELASELVARQEALEALHGFGDVLPAEPGMALDMAEAERLLCANAPSLAEALAQIAGREQYQVQIFWRERDALHRFREEEELAGLFASEGAIAPATLACAVDALRQRLAARFHARLLAACGDAVSLPLDRDAAMLVNLACLVERGAASRLETALEEIDALWPEGLTLRMIGPGPAASFCRIAAHPITADMLCDAAQRLALKGLAATMPSADTIESARRSALRGQGRRHPQEINEAAALLTQSAAAAEALATAGHDSGPPLPLVTIRRDDGLSGAPRAQPMRENAA